MVQDVASALADSLPRYNDAIARRHDVMGGWEIRGPYAGHIHASVAVAVPQHLHHPVGAGLRGALESLVRLHAAHLRVTPPFRSNFSMSSWPSRL